MEGGGGGMAVVERMRGMLDELARELTSQTPSENPTRVSELEAEVAALRSQHTTLTHTAHQAEVRAAQRESELRDQIKVGLFPRVHPRLPPRTLLCRLGRVTVNLLCVSSRLAQFVSPPRPRGVQRDAMPSSTGVCLDEARSRRF